MKKYILIYLLLLNLATFAQYEYNIAISNVDGLLVSYDYSWAYLAQTHTQKTFFQPYHNLFIGGMGNFEDSDGRGAIGLVLGIPGKDFSLLLKEKENFYTSEGNRIVSIAPCTIGIIGGKVRFMATDFDYNFLNSYWFAELDFLSYQYNATIQEGAFGYYNYREEKQSLNTVDLNIGLKYTVIKVGGGIGIGWGLENVGKTYSSPEEDVDIYNNPTSKTHFMANVFLGISLDVLFR
jgi:hypothetical protein